MAQVKHCVVTGANQGIGLEIVRKIAQHSGTRAVLTARNEERGRAGLAQLRRELPPEAAERLDYHQLDITDAASVRAFADWARSELGGRIDVLVNNAGFAYKGSTFGADEAEHTIAVNYRGTAAVCEALQGLLPDRTGRVVNVCSMAGKLGIVRDAALRARFEGAASRAELDSLAAEFVAAIRRGTHEREGWPGTMYGVSKLLECMYTRVLAAQLRPRGIAVNGMCPGWCSTSMSSFKGPRSAAEGADTAAWLALEAPHAESGLFFKDRVAEPW